MENKGKDLRNLKRGDIVWFNNKNDYSRHVQKGRRPAVILQNEEADVYGQTYVIAMITGSIKKDYLPVHIVIENVGLKRRSMVMLEQILTIDKGDVDEYVGALSEEYLRYVNKACMVSLGLTKTYNMVRKEQEWAARFKAEYTQQFAKDAKAEEPKSPTTTELCTSTVQGPPFITKELIQQISSTNIIQLLEEAERFKVKEMCLSGLDTHYVAAGDSLAIHYSSQTLNIPLTSLHTLIDELSEIRKLVPTLH